MFELSVSSFHLSALLMSLIRSSHAIGLSAISVCVRCFPCPSVLRRDSVSNSGQSINVVHRSDKFSLHAGSEKGGTGISA